MQTGHSALQCVTGGEGRRVSPRGRSHTHTGPSPEALASSPRHRSLSHGQQGNHTSSMKRRWQDGALPAGVQGMKPHTPGRGWLLLPREATEKERTGHVPSALLELKRAPAVGSEEKPPRRQRGAQPKGPRGPGGRPPPLRFSSIRPSPHSSFGSSATSQALGSVLGIQGEFNQRP